MSYASVAAGVQTGCMQNTTHTDPQQKETMYRLSTFFCNRDWIDLLPEWKR